MIRLKLFTFIFKSLHVNTVEENVLKIIFKTCGKKNRYEYMYQGFANRQDGSIEVKKVTSGKYRVTVRT